MSLVPKQTKINAPKKFYNYHSVSSPSVATCISSLSPNSILYILHVLIYAGAPAAHMQIDP